MNHKKTTLKVTKETKHNQYIDCEIEGAKVEGQETLFLRTKIFFVRHKKEFSITGVIFLFAALATIYSVFSPTKSFNLDTNNSPYSINTVNQTGDNSIVVANGNRSITSTQKAVTLEKLKKDTGSVEFFSKIFDPEALNYAEEIADLFEEAGWTVIEPVRENLLDDFGGGVNVFMTGTKVEDKIEIRTLTFIPFEKSNIEYISEIPRDGSISGSLNENTLYIEVGSK